ncbi:unnamed protein product [Brassica rapa subsp. trilocularis]|uniref:Uncharacterized protein n=1 Tax=Brassica campestris TaxID=3711 RepID=A0A3P5YTX3_BRACM|nr:unnamed protein product [Brassica rapa]
MVFTDASPHCVHLCVRKCLRPSDVDSGASVVVAT